MQAKPENCLNMTNNLLVPERQILRKIFGAIQCKEG
jgi:hypothetical protein